MQSLCQIFNFYSDIRCQNTFVLFGQISPHKTTFLYGIFDFVLRIFYDRAGPGTMCVDKFR
ncbi:MAG: hypothetical protein COC23_01125 [Hyphomicrobiales bacterium]|nr:MAG: hypothetical protein COC23_01125 [Hyphomicrobiales bacterium]